ncbi:MarR family winged helix-turn-helix transcriptional regulator [Curtobacterium ammoniigenes]|uniref:MarR family winged helix-turn-helix transcriptional regulator n=1 Tax=Curtobacterium ammoniigenes TaxID=395387 RepID=UPI0009FB47EE|nr:MarR family transcriptional regulator [Curtobacterium ammoniigenes]
MPEDRPGSARDRHDGGVTVAGGAEDEVDRIVAAWQRERPDLDFAPLHVLSRVGRVARHLELARRSAFAAGDMESWEFDVLSALRRAGAPYELSPKALLQQTLVSSGTMTNRVDRLAGRGLVSRRTDPRDGRGIIVSLTDAGRRSIDAAIAGLVQAEAALLADLEPEARRTLADLLRSLSVSLGD